MAPSSRREFSVSRFLTVKVYRVKGDRGFSVIVPDFTSDDKIIGLSSESVDVALNINCLTPFPSKTSVFQVTVTL